MSDGHPSLDSENGNGSLPDPLVDNEEFVENGDYSARLEQLQAKMQEMETTERETNERLQQECRLEMNQRLEALEETIKISVHDKLYNMEERHQAHMSDVVGSKQTEILRANKVIREVSRGLGSDWRFVFKFIMAGFPKEVIDIEIEKIERVKPFMQAYKALTTWKEYKAEEFDIRQLIKGLEDNLKTDLANLAREIMNTEGDGLMTVSNIGKGIASGVCEDDNDDSSKDGQEPTIQQRKQSLKEREAMIGPIDDTKLLHVARHLGEDWTNVGNMLELPEEDLQELQELDDTRQAAFRMLFQWRESCDGTAETELVETLRTVLKRSGRDDLSDYFGQESKA